MRNFVLLRVFKSTTCFHFKFDLIFIAFVLFSIIPPHPFALRCIQSNEISSFLVQKHFWSSNWPVKLLKFPTFFYWKIKFSQPGTFFCKANRTNQCNPNNEKTGPGHNAGYGGTATKSDKDNHSNQINPNNPNYNAGNTKKWAIDVVWIHVVHRQPRSHSFCFVNFYNKMNDRFWM